jgi:hypothetical protein
VPEPTRAGAQTAGPSPKVSRLARARWGDARLLCGIVLVMTSVAAGSRVMANADRSEQVWAASHDLAAGIRLMAADLQVRAVRLDAAQPNYLLAGETDPVGRVLTRAVSAGDLLPAAAVTPGPAAADPNRQVTVPVNAFHYPPGLARGRLVDVYVTPSTSSSTGSDPTAGAGASGPELLVAGALVVDVSDGGSGFGGPSASVGVVLSVPADEVADLVGGIRAGTVDLVQVPGS